MQPEPTPSVSWKMIRPWKMIRLGRWSSILPVVAVVALAAFLLVIPIPSARHHRWLHAFLNLGHVPLFALVTWVALVAWGRKPWVAALAAGLVAAGEAIQGFAPGRSVDFHDLIAGWAGVVIAWLWSAKETGRIPIRLAISGLALGVPIFDHARDLVDVPLGVWQAPVLADFSTWGQERRWRGRHGKVTRVRLPDGSWGGRLEFLSGSDDGYSGAEFIPVVTDWSGYQTLQITFDSPATIELNLSIRDRRTETGYDERYNTSGRFNQNRHILVYPLPKIARALRNRPLDLARMDSINFFIESKQGPGSITIRRIELLKD